MEKNARRKVMFRIVLRSRPQPKTYRQHLHRPSIFNVSAVRAPSVARSKDPVKLVI
jgi:hypothetical protein